jgi:hypothetical protein
MNSQHQQLTSTGVNANKFTVSTDGLNYVLGVHTEITTYPNLNIGIVLFQEVDIGKTLYAEYLEDSVVFRSTNPGLDEFITEHRAIRKLHSFDVSEAVIEEEKLMVAELMHRQLGIAIMKLNKPGRVTTVIEDHDSRRYRYWIYNTLRLPHTSEVHLLNVNGTFKLWENQDVQYPPHFTRLP